jgi:hypothetical protein
VKKFRATFDEIVALVSREMKQGKSVEQMQKENLLAPYAAWQGGFLKPEQFIAIVARDLQNGPAAGTR